MRKLEQELGDALAVVGVHSGKYTTERVTERIAHAVRRLGVEHPVVNDRQFRVWRAYAVNAWPTIVIVDARGYVIGQHAGEFTADEVRGFLGRAIEAARDALPDEERAPVVQVVVEHERRGALRYPTKVAVDGARIAIADSGHHRVLVGDLVRGGRAMRVRHSIGGERGYVDGAREAARFDAPQGLRFDGERLLVCDAGSHTLRTVSLESGEVSTLAGIGRQLRTSADRREGALSSPWDVVRAGERLFIAMAGSHQIHSCRLDGGDLRVHAGTRREDIVDGRLAEAALAQPMGIAADVEANRLYFVDAESSAVRSADTAPDGEVRTIIGTGLFDFGDRDGAGEHVLMQHQQALAVEAPGQLLVADSYNDAIKRVDVASGAATTLMRGFHEPSGLALGDALLYVADTNAHRIAVAAIDGSESGELAIEGAPA